MDHRSNREKMLAGDWYIACDPDNARISRRAAELCQDLATSPQPEAILQELLGSCGSNVTLKPPLYVDYGENIHIGSHVFANFGLTALDVAEIHIGDHTQIGPHVQLLTPIHPLDSAQRRAGWEAARPIVIGANVWLGGGIVCPGVTIGDNSVIGAGSVVTKDIPAHSLAVGNPARVIRQLD